VRAHAAAKVPPDAKTLLRFLGETAQAASPPPQTKACAGS
jgi:hypothetical protein